MLHIFSTYFSDFSFFSRIRFRGTLVFLCSWCSYSFSYQSYSVPCFPFFQAMSSRGSSNASQASEILEFRRREESIVRRVRVLEDRIRQWVRRADELEVRIEELQEALQDAREREIEVRAIGNIGPEFP